MKKKIQCERCHSADEGEQLYIFEGKQYCAICLVDAMRNAGYLEIGIGEYANYSPKTKVSE